MFRLLPALLYLCFYQVLLVDFAAVFGAQNYFAIAAPAVVTFAVFFLKPLEAVVLVLGVGFVTDALSGMMIGYNMSAMLVLWFVSLLVSSSLLGRAHWWVIGVFLLASSFVYRVGLGIVGNWGWQSLVLGPWFDALLGFVVIRVLQAALVRK